MDATLVTIPADGLVLVTRALQLPKIIDAVRITTPEDAQGAVDQTRQIKDLAAQLDENRKALTRPLDDQKKAIMDAYRPAVEALDRAEKVLKAEIGRWDAEQRRLAAEAAKVRAAQEAEDRKRQKAEQDQAAQLLAKADELAAAGDLAGAEALEAQAAAAQAAAAPASALLPAAVAPVQIRGASTRKIWKCNVVDPSKVDRAYMIPNQAVLDALAATAKGVGPAPSGCEWVSTSSTSIR